MVVELCAYGIFAGVFKDVKINDVAKVLLVQICGRLVRAVAVVAAVYVAGSESIRIASIWTTVVAGLAGIAIQLVAIPLIMKAVRKYVR